MDTVRVGVIGSGFQGEAQLQELAAIDGVELTAIADLDPVRLARVADRFGIPHRHSDAAELLAHRLDLVSVCTMPNTHREFVVGALERGSHVLCEKPFARSVEEAIPMVRAAERADRLLMVGYTMRFLEATAAVRRFVGEGLLGELVCARGHTLYNEVPWHGKHYVQAVSGGGALASLAVHVIDLLMWLAGNPRPLTASASMTTVFPRKRADSAPGGAAELFDVEDVLFGHVRFEGGFWLTVETAWTSDRPGRTASFDAFGTRGEAHLTPLELYTDRDGIAVRVDEDFPADSDDDDLRGELHAVVESVRAGRADERLATARQALDVQAVSDALYRSAREGREVAVERPEV